MNRRRFLSTLGFGILGLPLVGAAPVTGKVPRVGVLSPNAPRGFEALRQGLRDLGYVEGQSIRIEPRFAEPGDDMADLAANLVRDNVDIIVTGSTGAAVAAKQVTQTIPIVMAAVGDPVELGLVASLARPGGNLTGVAGLSGEVSGKRLALLKEAIPRLVRVAVLWNPTNTGSSTLQVRNVATAARSLAIQIQLLEVRDVPDFDGTFQAAERGHAQAVLATADALFSTHLARLAELALHHRLPMFGSDTGFAAAGALMNFGANIFETWRRSAVFVDKILKGAKPADLPVEQATKFELVINLKTAKALKLTIPQSLLLRADEVIQ